MKEAKSADRPGGAWILDERQASGLGEGGGSRIRCPRCAWEPERDSLWRCVCLYLWNTFETDGVCPSCAKRWEVTQCLRCKAWSPHRAWYAGEDPPR